MSKIITSLFCLFIGINAICQIWDPQLRCEVDASGNCLPTTILTAVPFLRIAPDARGGSMAEAGIVADPSAASMHYNASNLVFAEDKNALSLNFTPWLQALNLDDLYLSYIAGYNKLNKNEVVGGHIRYFSLGKIVWIGSDGIENGVGSPREFELAAAYARKLGDNFSAGLTGKYIYSNLASGAQAGGQLISAGTSIAADISLTYRKRTNISKYKGYYAIGMNLSNLGSKLSYTENAIKDFIPTNLGIGGMLRIDFDNFNTLAFVLDVNKLMVPSPASLSNPEWDVKGKKNVADWSEKTLFDGVFGSFSDAQAGFSEELKEFYYSLGIEYLYDKQFAVRGGYFYENQLKGGRRFFNIGAGIKYSVFEFNLSYLAPTSIQRTPLDNTLRFGVNFNFSDFKETLESEE
jgi:hypothetical protein